MTAYLAAPLARSLRLALQRFQLGLRGPELDPRDPLHELTSALWLLAPGPVTVALPSLHRLPVLIDLDLIVLEAPIRPLGRRRGVILVAAVSETSL